MCEIHWFVAAHQVLDSLLEKSHCGYSPDWSLVESINELQMGIHILLFPKSRLMYVTTEY